MALCLSMSPVMVALETQRLERKVSGSLNSVRCQSVWKNVKEERAVSLAYIFLRRPHNLNAWNRLV